MASSALFAPYRTVGQVCAGEQACFQRLGSADFFTVSIGSAFAVYAADHLSLAALSTPTAFDITHVAAHKEISFTATAIGIVMWNRTKPMHILTWHDAASSSQAALLHLMGAKRRSGGAVSSRGGLAAPLQKGAVVSLLMLGDYLLSLHDDGALRVWETKSLVAAYKAGERAGSSDANYLVTWVQLPRVHTVTCMMHPDTYLNKVAIGTEAGSVLIVNIRSGKIVYESKLARGTPVTALAQSNVVDVVGVGLADGRIIVHNLRLDKSVCTFAHAAADRVTGAGRVTGLAFSVDNALAHPTLASTTANGALALWNLETKSLQALLPAAHNAGIMTVTWLPHQACILTAGMDNAMHTWRVDKFDDQPRLLRSRAGHQAPPRIIRYYGGASVASLATGANAAACEIASAGSDRALRMFHTALERQNCELSQGSLVAKAKELGVHPNTLRLPPVTALAVSDRRYAQWSDVVTAHAGESRAMLWNWEHKKIDERVLQLPNEQEPVTAVCISTCGNFAILGGALGSLVQYNLQSAARRGTFPKDGSSLGRLAAKGARYKAGHDNSLLPRAQRDVGQGKGLGHRLGQADSVDTSLFKVMGVTPAAAKGASAGAASSASAAGAGGGGALSLEGLAHTTAVNGVAVDALNGHVVSVDASGLVLFWDFVSHACKAALQLPATASALVMHKDADLVAIACDDFVVRVVDASTHRLVRQYHGHTNRVTDMTFSPDARWLVSASMDRSVRVWDLPTGRCIDWLAFENAPTSVAFSPTHEYLVTAHVDTVGLCLWANRAHFSNVVLEGIPSEPTLMNLPAPAVLEEGEEGGETTGASAVARAAVGTKRRAAAGAAASARPAFPGADADGEDEEAVAATSGAETESVHSEDDGVSAASEARVSGGAKRARRATLLFATEPVGRDEEGHVLDIQPKAACHITLSGLPTSTWQNLTKLDMIAARNKPIQPPKKPAKAPFFLPTTGGLNPSFLMPPPEAVSTATGSATAASVAPDAAATSADADWSSAWQDAEEDAHSGTLAEEEEDATSVVPTTTSSRILRSSGARASRSRLAAMLRTTTQMHGTILDAHAADISQYLASLQPAAVDVEVRSLCLNKDDEDGVRLLQHALLYFAHELRAGRRFDLTQAQLQLLLQIYQDVVVSCPQLQPAAAACRRAQEGDALRLSSMLDQGLCLVATFLGQ